MNRSHLEQREQVVHFRTRLRPNGERAEGRRDGSSEVRHRRTLPDRYSDCGDDARGLVRAQGQLAPIPEERAEAGANVSQSDTLPRVATKANTCIGDFDDQTIAVAVCPQDDGSATRRTVDSVLDRVL